MSEIGLARISMESRMKDILKAVKSVEQSYELLKDPLSDCAKEHQKLIRCYSDVLNVYSDHLDWDTSS